MMNNSDDESIAREEERRRDEERRREAGIGVPGATGAGAGDQSAARKEERRREAGIGVAGATGGGSNGRRSEERRRETWFGLLGAAFLGAFLLIFFQGSLVQGFQSLTASSTSPVVRSSSQGVVIAPNAGNLTQTTQTAASNSQVTAAVAASTVTPTTPAVEGPLTAPFTGGATAVHTSQSYTGPMTITVSGTGQAQGTMHSDAFYIYTDAHGNPVAPSHHTYATLCINGHPVDQFVQPIPPYSSDHTYKLTINAPGGPLTFGVCDSILTDNSGSFTITFS
jgi:hypothetical protein